MTDKVIGIGELIGWRLHWTACEISDYADELDRRGSSSTEQIRLMVEQYRKYKHQPDRLEWEVNTMLDGVHVDVTAHSSYSRIETQLDRLEFLIRQHTAQLQLRERSDLFGRTLSTE